MIALSLLSCSLLCRKELIASLRCAIRKSRGNMHSIPDVAKSYLEDLLCEILL